MIPPIKMLEDNGLTEKFVSSSFLFFLNLLFLFNISNCDTFCISYYYRRICCSRETRSS